MREVQNGEDNCQAHNVSREQLRDLLGLVKQVIKHPKRAPDLLPTESGYFFGGTEYGSDYFDDLKYTRDMLTTVLDEPGDADFYYDSSW